MHSLTLAHSLHTHTLTHKHTHTHTLTVSHTHSLSLTHTHTHTPFVVNLQSGVFGCNVSGSKANLSGTVTSPRYLPPIAAYNNA